MIKIERLIWDNWNIKHIGKHKVTTDEVGEAAPKGKNKYYVVTVRDTSKKERRILNDQS